ncbi:hypothetical protein [Streptomyces sp. TRM75563]|uniref:hypothetical protein n=1 Tax=Streptomyces sp. TRM75563 TaxID=2817418 RepID=UPI001F6113EB|nr:hypothetical protein [Streptomyces sp. TRM75563]MCI4045759.1 hypothetical protein [Streptomyces sp. TRM75563]
MDTEEVTAAETSPAASSRGFYGCAIALIAFFTLIALGAHAFTEFEKGLDGDGQLERPGRSGSAYHPLGPGTTARYEDGLRVTVGFPERHDDGTYRLTVTFRNGTDKELLLGEEAYSDTLDVEPGASGQDSAPGHDVNWLNGDEVASALAPPLPEGEERTVPVRLQPDREGAPVTVDVTPPHPGYRETARFRLTLG